MRGIKRFTMPISIRVGRLLVGLAMVALVMSPVLFAVSQIFGDGDVIGSLVSMIDHAKLIYCHNVRHLKVRDDTHNGTLILARAYSPLKRQYIPPNPSSRRYPPCQKFPSAFVPGGRWVSNTLTGTDV